MSQAPTPGPWEVKVYEDYPGHYKLKTPTRNQWATATPSDILDEEQANARLMEAAPDLLAELKDLVERFKRALLHTGSAGDEEIAETAVSRAKILIAKAEGLLAAHNQSPG